MAFAGELSSSFSSSFLVLSHVSSEADISEFVDLAEDDPLIRFSVTFDNCTIGREKEVGFSNDASGRGIKGSAFLSTKHVSEIILGGSLCPP